MSNRTIYSLFMSSKKRKATPAQLRNLARGRKIRKANLAKGRKGKRKTRSLRRKKKPKRINRRKSTGDIGNQTMQMLTGGTNDVNPQFMGAFTKQLVENTATFKEVMLPVTRIPGAKRVTLIEALKLWVCFDEYPYMNLLAWPASRTHYVGLYFGKVTDILGFHNGKVLMAKYYKNISASWQVPDPGEETMFGATIQEMPWSFDFTDNQGHGILIATDCLTLAINSTNLLESQKFGAQIKLLYRFKSVGLQEYIGIVQSQQ